MEDTVVEMPEHKIHQVKIMKWLTLQYNNYMMLKYFNRLITVTSLESMVSTSK